MQPRAVEGLPKRERGAAVTPEARRILLHTLGLQPTVEGAMYRNRYISGATPPPGMVELVDLGLMVERQRPGFLPAADRSWAATDAGKAAASAEHAATLPRITRAQRRYRAWLRETDASGESFGDWLRRGGR